MKYLAITMIVIILWMIGYSLYYYLKPVQSCLDTDNFEYLKSKIKSDSSHSLTIELWQIKYIDENKLSFSEINKNWILGNIIKENNEIKVIPLSMNKYSAKNIERLINNTICKILNL